MGDCLVEDGKAVAGGAFCCLSDQREGIVFGGNLFRLDHMRKVGREQFSGNAAQVETLATGKDGDGNLVHLGRGEQEFYMRGRLFERLEKRVERVLRKHVNFVDNVNFVACGNCGIAHRLDNLAYIVDTSVAGGVHFDHVDVAALCNCLAGFAHAAGIDRGAALPVRSHAVQRLCDQAGR